ncbi:hypothetical protein BDM02DRAFT_2989799 [Thelephora ganbajun]|uniref:Uncharacterized protein n=1 Tax=Thelephora ganbajun TaxID=370292 RepID=A0ACB6ZAT4_THEGA|nr:hypothetical protein BDM02DRAFT_2989799 [Thelephora ganbajun]
MLLIFFCRFFRSPFIFHDFVIIIARFSTRNGFCLFCPEFQRIDERVFSGTSLGSPVHFKASLLSKLPVLRCLLFLAIKPHLSYPDLSIRLPPHPHPCQQLVPPPPVFLPTALVSCQPFRCIQCSTLLDQCRVKPTILPYRPEYPYTSLLNQHSTLSQRDPTPRLPCRLSPNHCSLSPPRTPLTCPPI